LLAREEGVAPVIRVGDGHVAMGGAWKAATGTHCARKEEREETRREMRKRNIRGK